MIAQLMFLFVLTFTNNSGDDLKIKEPWIRPGAKGMATAFYFNVENNFVKADTLYKVQSDLAGKVEIHETYKKDDMMGMREVEFIVIPANSIFNFKPGAHHIMLMKLKDDLKADSEGEISLFFKNAGEIKVKAKVRKN